MRRRKTLALLVLYVALQGCVGTLIGTGVSTVVDTTIEVAKVPFKVAGAVVDVATNDD